MSGGASPKGALGRGRLGISRSAVWGPDRGSPPLRHVVIESDRSLPVPFELRHTRELTLLPVPPFHFDGTVYKPSHFPADHIAYRPGRYWQTLRLGDDVVGLRMESSSSAALPAIAVTLFSDSPISDDLCERVTGELRWRFDLDADLRPFFKELKDDAVLRPAFKRWRGMRVSCASSLYEFLIIAIMLQNATVRRSVKMLRALFERYGSRLRFDRQDLIAFWPPHRISAASEQDLRALALGYRARSLKRMTEAFAGGGIEELAIRRLDREAARRELLKLYGMGPASVGYALFEVFHHYDAFDSISPWEQQVYSRLLFDRKLVPAERLLGAVRRRWGRWRMLAAHYLFEDLFWQHQRKPIPWLAQLIRL